MSNTKSQCYVLLIRVEWLGNCCLRSLMVFWFSIRAMHFACSTVTFSRAWQHKSGRPSAANVVKNNPTHALLHSASWITVVVGWFQIHRGKKSAWPGIWLTMRLFSPVITAKNHLQSGAINYFAHRIMLMMIEDKFCCVSLIACSSTNKWRPQVHSLVTKKVVSPFFPTIFLSILKNVTFPLGKPKFQ